MTIEQAAEVARKVFWPPERVGVIQEIAGQEGPFLLVPRDLKGGDAFDALNTGWVCVYSTFHKWIYAKS